MNFAYKNCDMRQLHIVKLPHALAEGYAVCFDGLTKVGNTAEGLTEALEVDYFSFAKEADGVDNIGVIG